jgi:hypothetical protein
MREIRKSGSEGGARQTNVSFLPLSLKRRFAAETWGMRTEALGSAEEAHRRWPKGRSEQGASKANDAPPTNPLVDRGHFPSTPSGASDKPSPHEPPRLSFIHPNSTPS